MYLGLYACIWWNIVGSTIANKIKQKGKILEFIIFFENNENIEYKKEKNKNIDVILGKFGKSVAVSIL